MERRIKEFLQQHGGHATALQIARYVFHIRNASAALADRLIRAAVGAATGIESDGLGSWHLVPGATEKIWQEEKFCLIEAARGSVLAFGWTTIIHEHIATPTFAVVAGPTLQLGASMDIEAVAAPELHRRLHQALSGAILVAWRPAKVMQSLSLLATAVKGSPFFCDALSMPALAQNLLGLPTLPKPEKVYSLLGLSRVVFEEPLAAVEESAAVFVEMLSRCRGAGILTTARLLLAGRRHARRLDMALYDFDRKFLESLPECPGIYMMRDRKDRVMYVGKAKNLRARVMSYFQRPEEEEPKLRRLQKTLRSLCYEACDTEVDALIREYELIRAQRPEVNRQVDLHDQEETGFRVKPCVFVVPISDSRRLAIYFLSPSALEKVGIVAGRRMGKRLRATVQSFMQHVASAERHGLKSPFGNHRVLLASRWFAQHRGRLTVLDADQLRSTDDCLQRLQNLIADPEVFSGRVEMRGTP